MANVAKFTRMQALAVISHQERTCKTHSNENIDSELSKYNYCVWPFSDEVTAVEKRGWKALNKRLSEVKRLHRKDVNVLVEWSIHLGADVPPGYDNEEAFFKACMNYCAKQYGEENICYGIVHVDEKNPHLTVGFVPVVKKPLKIRKNASEAKRKAYEAMIAEGVTEIEVVDANSLINRKHLIGWHGNLTSYLKEELGYDPAIYTGITKELGGNVSVKALKKKPKDWRKQRDKRAQAFHEKRRAARDKKQVDLETQLQNARDWGKQ